MARMRLTQDAARRMALAAGRLDAFKAEYLGRFYASRRPS